MILEFNLNGQKSRFLIEPSWTLLELVRDHANLQGTKCGCDTGECGLCVVLLDNKPVLSCLTLAAVCEGKNVTTIEGISGKAYEALKKAFCEEGAAQCGFCTPSMILVLTKLLENKHRDVKEELSGHICRCTGFTPILKAYERAEQSLNSRE